MLGWIWDFILALKNGRCAECGKAIMYYKQEISGIGPGCGPHGGSVSVHSNCTKAFYATTIKQEPYISRTRAYKKKIGW